MVETVLYDKRDRMAFVTLNRPDAKNAIDPEMHDELCRIWGDFRDDDDVDVAILSGTGDAFCAGLIYGVTCQRTTSMPRRPEFARLLTWALVGLRGACTRFTSR